MRREFLHCTVPLVPPVPLVASVKTLSTWQAVARSEMPASEEANGHRAHLEM